MKRCAKVALTLLPPLMASFGCSRQTSVQTATPCEPLRAADGQPIPPQAGQPPTCAAPGTQHSTHHSHWGSSRRYGWGYSPYGGSYWSRSHTTPPPAPPVSSSHSTTTSHSPTHTAGVSHSSIGHSTTSHHTSSRTSFGGFGSSGSHHSGWS